MRVGAQSRVSHFCMYVVSQGFCGADSSEVLGIPGLGTRQHES
jgi:hypothetical protein